VVKISTIRNKKAETDLKPLKKTPKEANPKEVNPKEANMESIASKKGNPFWTPFFGRG
jgi:hypothetical protein